MLGVSVATSSASSAFALLICLWVTEDETIGTWSRERAIEGGNLKFRFTSRRLVGIRNLAGMCRPVGMAVADMMRPTTKARRRSSLAMVVNVLERYILEGR